MATEETKKFFQDEAYQILISKDEIRRKVKEIGKQISADYQGKCPILVGVLNGSFIFCADLFREINIDCEVDFIKITSYGNDKVSSGEVKLIKDVDAHLSGRDVLVVEDIVDSGHSVRYLKNRLKIANPKSLKFVSLLVKDCADKIPFAIDYIGFRIPNRFVVGYGLDFAQKFRNLREIYIME